MIARLAVVLAFASAAVTLYWTLGGTALLDTVGGPIEELARERSSAAYALGVLVVVAKVAAGLLALALLRDRRRPIVLVGTVGGTLLALYGGVLVIVGALVLVGVVDPSGPVDERALRWHVLLWDLWFVVWDAILALAGLRAGVPASTPIQRKEVDHGGDPACAPQAPAAGAAPPSDSPSLGTVPRACQIATISTPKPKTTARKEARPPATGIRASTRRIPQPAKKASSAERGGRTRRRPAASSWWSRRARRAERAPAEWPRPAGSRPR